MLIGVTRALASCKFIHENVTYEKQLMHLISPAWQRAALQLGYPKISTMIPSVSFNPLQGKLVFQCHYEKQKYFIPIESNFTVWKFCGKPKTFKINFVIQSEINLDMTQLLPMLEQYGNFKITLASIRVKYVIVSTEVLT